MFYLIEKCIDVTDLVLPLLKGEVVLAKMEETVELLELLSS